MRGQHVDRVVVRPPRRPRGSGAPSAASSDSRKASTTGRPRRRPLRSRSRAPPRRRGRRARGGRSPRARTRSAANGSSSQSTRNASSTEAADGSARDGGRPASPASASAFVRARRPRASRAPRRAGDRVRARGAAAFGRRRRQTPELGRQERFDQARRVRSDRRRATAARGRTDGWPGRWPASRTRSSRAGRARRRARGGVRRREARGDATMTARSRHGIALVDVEPAELARDGACCSETWTARHASTEAGSGRCAGRRGHHDGAGVAFGEPAERLVRRPLEREDVRLQIAGDDEAPSAGARRAAFGGEASCPGGRRRSRGRTAARRARRRRPPVRPGPAKSTSPSGVEHREVLAEERGELAPTDRVAFGCPPLDVLGRQERFLGPDHELADLVGEPAQLQQRPVRGPARGVLAEQELSDTRELLRGREHRRAAPGRRAGRSARRRRGSASPCIVTTVKLGSARGRRSSTTRRASSLARLDPTTSARRSGSAPSSIRRANRSRRIVVLPVPKPPETSIGPLGWSRTARCCGSGSKGAIEQRCYPRLPTCPSRQSLRVGRDMIRT